MPFDGVHGLEPLLLLQPFMRTSAITLKLRLVFFFLSWLTSHKLVMPIDFLVADRTNGRAYATVLRPSVVVCDVSIVAKRCVLEQKLLLTAYRKLYMRNRLVPK